MVTKRSRNVGAGLSQHSAQERWLELETDPAGGNPLNQADVREAYLALSHLTSAPAGPWGRHAEFIAHARARYDAMRLEVAHLRPGSDEFKEHFEERVNPNWYLRQIVKCATSVESNIEAERPWAAVQDAIEIGHLITEMNLKSESDRDYLFGRKQREKSSEGGRARRRHSAKERYDRAKAHIDKGMPVGRSFQLVAEELACSSQAVRGDYYKIIKSFSI